MCSTVCSAAWKLPSIPLIHFSRLNYTLTCALLFPEGFTALCISTESYPDHIHLKLTADSKWSWTPPETFKDIQRTRPTFVSGEVCGSIFSQIRQQACEVHSSWTQWTCFCVPSVCGSEISQGGVGRVWNLRGVFLKCNLFNTLVYELKNIL